MGGEWIDTTLGEVLTLQRGFDLPGTDRRPGSYPVIASTGPVGGHDEAMVRGPGVVIGRSGSLGGGQFIEGDFWPLNTTLWVKDFKGNDRRFCYYLLKSLDLAHFNAGSGVPTLNRNHVHPLPVTVPAEIAEQRAIANILGTLDDKIELNHRMASTLEEMARALFKAWFVDFEPVRAKMDGRWRRGKSLPGLPAHLYDLFPGRLVDSELGPIPEGWEVGRFSDVAENLRERENPLEWPKVVYEHFSIPAFDEGQWPKREPGTAIRSIKSSVPHGVVLLSKLNPEIERVWLVDVRPTDRSVCSTEFLVLQPRSPFGRCFVYSLARSPQFRQQIEALVTGTSKSHQRAQVGPILNIEIAFPPRQVAEAFERTASSKLNQTLLCRRESRALAALRDTLLPKLISGELRVKAAERFIAEVNQ